MPQSVAQLPVCSECGSEALGHALFCFNCGSRLEVENSGSETDEKEAPKENILPEIDKPIGPPSGDPFGQEPVEESDENGKTAKERKKAKSSDPVARTAAAVRQGEGLMRMRRIETRWTPDSESPNIWFIVASVVLVLAAFGIFLVSMYLR